MNEIYSTADVAATLGCSEAAIRSQKSRKSDRFTEGIHYIQDGSATRWTTAGVAVLRELMGVEVEETPSTTPLAGFADQLAWSMIEQQLPRQIQASVQRILLHPTEADVERMQRFLGGLGLMLELQRVQAALQAANQDNRALQEAQS